MQHSGLPAETTAGCPALLVLAEAVAVTAAAGAGLPAEAVHHRQLVPRRTDRVRARHSRRGDGDSNCDLLAFVIEHVSAETCGAYLSKLIAGAGRRLRRRRFLALGLAAACLAGCGQATRLPTTDRSDREWLLDAFDAQKRLYLSPEAYVVDRTRTDAPVTSEGQAYVLLQAAWMRDRETFTRVFDWTERHLRRADGLYSWLWTPEDGGRVVDANSATDADTDIAFALLIASRVFDAPTLAERAREIVVAVRTHASLDTAGGWIVSAGNWAGAARVVNLSYFSPFAYEYFRQLDPDGHWDEAIKAGYTLLEASLTGRPPRLPPDFLAVDAQGRPAPLPRRSRLSTDFSYDAMRVFWRIDLDCRLHRRARACVERGGARQAAVVMKRDQRLFSRYSTEAEPRSTSESLSFYGALLPAVEIVAPSQAGWIRTKRLTPEALDELLERDDRYYDLNWTWFGLASTSGLTVERTPRLRRLASRAPMGSTDLPRPARRGPGSRSR